MITEKYRAEIESGRIPAGERLPSSAALAEISGVSRLTADRAVEELQRLGLVKRDGRRGTVVCHREIPSTKRIALIVDQVDFEYSFPRPELLSGIHAGLGTEYDLVICDSKADPQREIELLNRMAEETDGIICWPTDHSHAGSTINDLTARGVPLVLLDRVPAGAVSHAVLSDSETAIRHSMDFLLERGHKRIALLTFDKPEVSTVIERCAVFAAVMEEHGLASQDLLRRYPASLEVAERAHFYPIVRDSLFSLVRSENPVTAVLCVQDLFGAAILRGAEEMNLAIPDDIEVVTFNDWRPTWLGRPWQAHRIVFQPGEMGDAAIEILRAQINRTAGEAQVHRIPSRFITVDDALSAPSICP